MLRHEFVDYLVCKAIEPYQDMVNALLSILSEKAYRKKEEVIESILKILENRPSSKYGISNKIPFQEVTQV